MPVSGADLFPQDRSAANDYTRASRGAMGAPGLDALAARWLRRVSTMAAGNLATTGRKNGFASAAASAAVDQSRFGRLVLARPST